MTDTKSLIERADEWAERLKAGNLEGGETFLLIRDLRTALQSQGWQDIESNEAKNWKGPYLAYNPKETGVNQIKLFNAASPNFMKLRGVTHIAKPLAPPTTSGEGL